MDIKFYRERWKAVEEIERQELRAMSIETRWRQINNLRQFAIEHGLTRGNNDGEMEVFQRWAKLKDLCDKENLADQNKTPRRLRSISEFRFDYPITVFIAGEELASEVEY